MARNTRRAHLLVFIGVGIEWLQGNLLRGLNLGRAEQNGGLTALDKYRKHNHNEEKWQ